MIYSLTKREKKSHYVFDAPLMVRCKFRIHSIEINKKSEGTYLYGKSIAIFFMIIYDVDFLRQTIRLLMNVNTAMMMCDQWEMQNSI